ncbi:MAG: sulfurtransferase-like selenium metabolism protein YedF [bacterium]|nr:sulfurtransferase-like selenium metabolism protein YedF [bacterium]
MTNKIDACGLACPQPVILTKKALEGMTDGVIEVIVDNKPASENVSRFAKNSGCKVELTETQDIYNIKITKGVDSKVSGEKIVCNKEEESKTVVFISSDAVGRGDDELGKILMKAFFPTLKELSPKPYRIIFMNNGVKLVTDGSSHLENLAELEKMGIEMLVCGTCLDFFHLKDKLKVGRVSNFFEISETFLRADKVISL